MALWFADFAEPGLPTDVRAIAEADIVPFARWGRDAIPVHADPAAAERQSPRAWVGGGQVAYVGPDRRLGHRPGGAR